MSGPVFSLPAKAPFSKPQADLVQSLLGTLNPSQAAWLSGFLAGIGGVEATAPVQAQPLTILYGSESGNAETCAGIARRAAQEAGFSVIVADMADYPHSKLAAEKNLLVIISTWGEGDPPERATAFHDFVMGETVPRLEGLNFAVFALGDVSYADFCECGKRFDRRLAELGGRRLLDRVDADVAYEEPFKKWVAAVIPALESACGAQLAAPRVQVLDTQPAAPTGEPFGKKNPFPAAVKHLVNLNGRGSAKETFHIEFSLEGSGLEYVPGDVAGVFPVNCPEVVADFLQAAGLSGGESIGQDGQAKLFRDALATDFDITSLNVALMKKYAPLAGNSALEAFLGSEDKDKLNAWLYGREVRDLLLEFPGSPRLGPDALAGILRKMPPRLYSIASSPRAHPGEVHLTVGAVAYAAHGRQRKGVCSTFLCQRIQRGETVRLYTHHNKNFGLPENGDAPVIMVGPGTGIAPFRAFVEERKAVGAKGRNWLFFGDQHFNTDFLYQLEWMDYLKDGVLTRMDVAFSRDTDHKVYVQHRMLEAARELYAWLQEGAYFYVCGDANRMAKDVHQALIDIHVQQGGLTPQAAEDAVKDLQKARRYQRDVY